MSGRRAEIARALVLLGLVAGSSCGRSAPEGMTGLDAAADAVVTSAACPDLVQHGGPCTGDGKQCPLNLCRKCIGQFWKVIAAPVAGCYCLNSAWNCPVELDALFRERIGDCVADAPMTCADAQTLYTDETCTVHPACAP